MISKKLLFIIFPALSISACKTTSQSDLKHDFGRFSNSTNSSQWLVTDDSMLQTTETLQGPQVFLPESEPIVIRLQAWADEIRKIMIAIDPRIAAVPRPLVRVVKKESANGFVLPGLVCVDLPLIKDSSAAAENTFITDSPYGMFAADYGERCFHQKGSAGEKLKFAQAAFPYHPECKIIAEQGIYRLSGACPIEGNAPTAGVAITAYANRFYIFSGTMKVKSESEIVGTIAHELGHYYMAHSRVLSGVYGYFYDEDLPSNGKPAALPDNDPRKQLGLDFINYRDVNSKVIAGEIYENNVTQAFVHALQDEGFSTDECADGEACKKECSELLTAIAPDSELYGILSPSEENLSKYLALQNSLKGCFSFIRSAKYIESVNRQLLMSLNESFSPLESSGDLSLYDLFASADKSVRKFVIMAQDKFAKAEKAMKQNPLGFYTHEQEADEFATEISLRLGFDGYNQANSQLKNMNPDERAECQKKLSDGFPQPERVQDFEDAHHEGCYRVYNIYREITKVHADQVKGLKRQALPKLPPDLKWEDMIRKMDQTLDSSGSGR